MADPWLNADDICEAVAFWTGLDADELAELERGHWHVCKARRLMWACLRANGMSWPAIAEFSGRRHHSTIWKALHVNPPEASEVRSVMALARQRQSATS